VLTEDIPKKASDREHLLLARSGSAVGGSADTGS